MQLNQVMAFGLGETIKKIYETMDDLRANDDILTIDDLQPSRKRKGSKYYTLKVW